MKLAFYIQPVLKELSKVFPELRVFTAEWPGYINGCEEAFEVETIGKFGHLILGKQKSDYDRSYLRLSLRLIPHLLDFKPEVLFTVGFNFWTILIALLKPLGNWQIIVVYSGSSPNGDMVDAKIRLLARKFISRRTSAFITNSQAGKSYLTNILAVPPDRIFAQPYQIPDQQSLLCSDDTSNCYFSGLKPPTFLFIGQTIQRKGLMYLLEACLLLNHQGYSNFSVVIVGEGSQRKEFETWSDKHGLQKQVRWEGWVSYNNLGFYFQNTDIFVFP
ncbi:MAG: glycosyltransferase family 4 protein, partial [Sphaerospermopsis kisseleviana]